MRLRNTMSRRQLLHGSLPLLSARKFSPASTRNKRPNVVMIVTDDQRYDELGCTGHPNVKTPHIDALASRGAIFENFFATSAVCLPARANLFTGQWERCHTVGGGGGRALSSEQWRQTFPMLLRRAGYFTGIIGKCNVMGTRQNEVDYYCGSDGTALGFYPKEFGPGKVLFHGAKSDTQVEVLGEAAADFLGTDHSFYERSLPGMRRYLARRPSDKPFLLYVAVEVPHGTGTRTMQQRPTDDPLYRTAYRDRMDRMRLVPGYVAKDEVKSRKLPLRVYGGIQHENYGYTANPATMREQEVRNCQTITGVDRLVGSIREQLERLDEADNTIFVFTSDQGIMYGEFGYGGKALLYEPAIHVPLIIYDPRPGGTREQRVKDKLSVTPDIAPTVLELCGVDIPPSMQGRSLVPLLQGKRAPWREDFFCECLMMSQDYPLVQGVRGSRWKYMRYWPIRPVPADYREVLNLGLNGEMPEYEELYDLKSDPGEQRNLAGDPSHERTLRRMRNRCVELQAQSLGRRPEAQLPSQTIKSWQNSERDYYQMLDAG